MTKTEFLVQLVSFSETNPTLAMEMYRAIRDFVSNKYHIRNILPEAHYLRIIGREFDSRINWFRMRIYYDIDHPNKPLMFDENVPECYSQALDELARHHPDGFVFPEGLEYLTSVGEEIMPAKFQGPQMGHFFDEVPDKDDIEGLLNYLLPYKEKAEAFLLRAKQFQDNPLSVTLLSPADCDLLSRTAEKLNRNAMGR